MELVANRRRRRSVRRFACVLVAVVAALTLAGCRHSSGQARPASPSTATSTTPPRRVTSRLEVASRTIKAGSAVTVVLVIENDTGKPIPQPVCHRSTDWQAYLVGGHAISGPLPVASGPVANRAMATRCDRTKRPDSVPTGESRLSYTTHATYFECAPAPDSYPPTPKCLQPDDEMPPLPPGRYTLTVNESPYVGVPKPQAILAVIVR
jgi:hypothetical protein